MHLEQQVIFSIGSVDYAAFIEGCTVDFLDLEDGFTTVLNVPEMELGSRFSLQAMIDFAQQQDDVLCTEFLSSIILIAKEEMKGIEVPPVCSSLRILKIPSDFNLLPGPYLIHGGKMHQIFRLYDDELNAISLPIRQISPRSIIPLRIGSTLHSTACVAVPSRLRFSPSESKPLSGIRISVKDIFDIQGLRTSIGSREHLKLYPPVKKTAPAIQSLMDSGCQLISLSKMCSTVLKQEPTQSIEFLAPFNPRADGWQSPSGGSSGQAVAIAKYDWLDITIASDSTFSGRMPAQVAGIFSLRPSTGLISTEGMWSGVPQWDTPCFFGRDLSKFQDFVKSWYGKEISLVLNPCKSYKLLYFEDFLPKSNVAQIEIFQGMIRDMENMLSVKANSVSISQEWLSSPPPEAVGMRIEEFLAPEIATGTYVYTFWKRLQHFWTTYQQRFSRKPYLPLPKHVDTWKSAQDIEDSQHKKCLNRIDVYKRWILRTFLKEDRHTLVVSLLGDVKPFYRHEWPGIQEEDQMLWSPLMLSPILGAPELIVPAGELSFLSKVTGTLEFLPVCVTVLGWPGSDLDLIETTYDLLRKSGRPTRVNTGSRMF